MRKKERKELKEKRGKEKEREGKRRKERERKGKKGKERERKGKKGEEITDTAAPPPECPIPINLVDFLRSEG